MGDAVSRFVQRVAGEIVQQHHRRGMLAEVVLHHQDLPPIRRSELCARRRISDRLSSTTRRGFLRSIMPKICFVVSPPSSRSEE